MILIFVKGHAVQLPYILEMLGGILGNEYFEIPEVPTSIQGDPHVLFIKGNMPSMYLTIPKSVHSFSRPLSPPSQRPALKIDLPIETFDSFGRGSTSFSGLAEDTASTWNTVGLLPDHKFFSKTTPIKRGPCVMDGIKTITFSKTNCAFEWGVALGITSRWWLGGENAFEADVLFNENVQWGTYPGSI